VEVIENKGADLQDFGTSVQLAANLVRRMGVCFSKQSGQGARR